MQCKSATYQEAGDSFVDFIEYVVNKGITNLLVSGRFDLQSFATLPRSVVLDIGCSMNETAPVIQA